MAPRQYDAVSLDDFQMHPSDDDGQNTAYHGSGATDIPPKQPLHQQHQVPATYAGDSLQPRRLDWNEQAIPKLMRLTADIIVFAMALLFMIFGFLVYRYDRSELKNGSEANMLLSAAKYGPTIYPILFAAIAGGGAKALATWSIQRGTTIGKVDQLLGSNTISGAFFTQFKLRAINFLAVCIIIVWCLSPVGSQAVLRVAYSESAYNTTSMNITTVNSFSAYEYGNAESMAEALTLVISPFTALVMAGKLLSTRNQDFWSNVRVPRIDDLADESDYSWKDITNSSTLTYASLVGLPLSPMLDLQNQTFTINNASYLDVKCDTPTTQKFVNYTSPNAPKPGGKTDCSWTAVNRNQFDFAISLACDDQPSSFGRIDGVRDARHFVWQSLQSSGSSMTNVNCRLQTAYVDLSMICQQSVCSPTAVRRARQPSDNGNWTTLDLMGGSEIMGFTMLWNEMFPSAGIAGSTNPIVGYVADPTDPSGSSGYIGIPPSDSFELRVMQLLNSVLMLGTGNSVFTWTGSFNSSASGFDLELVHLNATSSQTIEVLRCDRAWLGVLILTSLVMALLALGSAAIRFVTVAPDILGSISVAMLDNKATEGLTVWDASERARAMKHVAVQLGDVAAGEEVGRLGVVAPIHAHAVAQISTRKLYS